MIVTNDAVKMEFRQKRICEVCLKAAPDGCDPCHVHAKGMGGGRTLDVSINLVSAHRICHTRIHNGDFGNGLLLEIVADRYRTTTAVVEEALWYMERLPKGTSKRAFLAGAEVLDAEVKRLLAMVIDEVYP